MNELKFLILLYILITLVLIYQAHEADELDLNIVLWPKRLAMYIGFKKNINFNTMIGIGLGMFYIYLYSGKAEELTHFISATEVIQDKFSLPRAVHGLGIINLFAFVGLYLIAVTPGLWVAAGYIISFITLITIFSF